MVRQKSFMFLCALAVMAAGCSASGERGVWARQRLPDNAPKVGAVAPTFELKSLNADATVALAGFRGNKPVVLFFGSYT